MLWQATLATGQGTIYSRSAPSARCRYVLFSLSPGLLWCWWRMPPSSLPHSSMLPALISPPGLVSRIWIDSSCGNDDQALHTLVSPSQHRRGNLMFYKCTTLWTVFIVTMMGIWCSLLFALCLFLRILSKCLLSCVLVKVQYIIDHERMDRCVGPTPLSRVLNLDNHWTS